MTGPVASTKNMTMIQRARRRGRRSEIKNLAPIFVVLALFFILFCSATTTVNGFIVVVGQKQKQQRAQLSSTTSRTSFRQLQLCRTSPVPASVVRNRNDLIICRRSSSRDDDSGVSFESSSSSSTTTKSDEEQKIDIVDAVFKGKSGSKNAVDIVDDDDDDASPPLLVDKIDGFLDKPFFDPDEYDDDDDSFFGKFAQLVKSDYELFEAFFVGCFFLLLITVAKDLLRAQMVASAVTSSGRLF